MENKFFLYNTIQNKWMVKLKDCTKLEFALQIETGRVNDDLHMLCEDQNIFKVYAAWA